MSQDWHCVIFIIWHEVMLVVNVSTGQIFTLHFSCLPHNMPPTPSVNATITRLWYFPTISISPSYGVLSLCCFLIVSISLDYGVSHIIYITRLWYFLTMVFLHSTYIITLWWSYPKVSISPDCGIFSLWCINILRPWYFLTMVLPRSIYIIIMYPTTLDMTPTTDWSSNQSNQAGNCL